MRRVRKGSDGNEKIDTRLVTAGRSKRYTQGSVNSVIQRASSLVFDSVADKQRATAGRASGELFYGGAAPSPIFPSRTR